MKNPSAGALATRYSRNRARAFAALIEVIHGFNAALEQIAELECDGEKQQFKLTRFQAAQIARDALNKANKVGDT